VPVAMRSDELQEVIGYLRAMLARVDSSLVEEWESLMNPGEPKAQQPAPQGPRRKPTRVDLAADPRALEVLVRAELHLLVRALSVGDFEEAACCVRQDPEDPWDADRFEAALAPFLEEYGSLRFDPTARRTHLTVFRKRTARLFDVNQVLVDEREDNLWSVEGEVDLEDELDLDIPLVRIRRIGT
jgi:hypothetical protein